MTKAKVAYALRLVTQLRGPHARGFISPHTQPSLQLAAVTLSRARTNVKNAECQARINAPQSDWTACKIRPGTR